MATQRTQQQVNQIERNPVYYDAATGGFRTSVSNDLMLQRMPEVLFGLRPVSDLYQTVNLPTPQPAPPAYRPAQPIGMQGLFPNMGMPTAAPMQTNQSFGAGRFLSPSLLSSLGSTPTTSNP